MHGMAGTAMLMLLVLQTAASTEMSLVYIVLFGSGSMIGMIVLSLLVAFPIRRSGYFSARLNKGVRGAAALLTLIVGVVIMIKTGDDVGLLFTT